ncbi:transglycosylase family protein [Streptomyces sp. NPDC005271]|uniref:transglycosylase family protein n=1 Tax=unclassified Streptomyces TaxID=2593676 RepID=UPI0033B62DCD
MLSGNGRHRRPRQAPAIVVAAGVTGASIAIPLFGAGGAQAAPATTWDRVAECESGGMWSANEGNGFYGGLQLTLDMWKSHGGTDYAPRPDLASRSQQITVAESILGDRGPDAWPSCALNAGLSDGSGAPDVDPGSTATPDRPGSAQRGDTEEGRGLLDGVLPSDASGDSGSSDTPRTPDASPSAEKPDAPRTSQSPDGLDDSTSSPDPSASPDAPDSSADPAPSGRHRGEEGAGERAGDGSTADARPSGKHASRGDADRAQGSTGDDYTVRPGDNLSAIAQRGELADGWHGLYDTNEQVIGSDPDLILPGQRLDLSAKGR